MQNENRILLKKMLQIDLKPSSLNPNKINLKQTPSSSSLNRVSRLKELMRVNEENKSILRRLQGANSVYDRRKWEDENNTKNYLKDNILRNSGMVVRFNPAARYCRHPYFIQTPNLM